MLFLSRTNSEQRKHARELKRRSERRQQKQRHTVVRSTLTVFSALILVATIWSLRAYRKSWSSGLLHALSGPDSPDRAVNATHLASQLEPSLHTPPKPAEQKTESRDEDVGPERDLSAGESTMRREGSELPGGEDPAQRERPAAREERPVDAPQSRVDTATPQQAPGLLPPAEEARASAATSGGGREERGTVEGAGSEEKSHPKAAEEDAVLGQEAASAESAEEKAIDEDLGGKEDVPDEEDNDEDLDAFDESLAEEEGGRTPIFTLGRRGVEED